MTERTLWRVHLAVLLAYVAGAVALWPHLPARLPLHFDFAGRVTAWTNAAVWSWFGLPASAVGLALLLRGLAALAASAPETWSVPEQERFLALSPAARAPIERRLRTEGALVSLTTTLVLMTLHIGMYRTAVARSASMPWYASAAMGALLIGLLIHVAHARRKFRARILEAERSGSASGH